MRLKLRIATAEDAAGLGALHAAVNRHLASQYGAGFWSSSAMTGRGALFSMRRSAVFIARRRRRLIATLALSTPKPWAIDTKYFSDSARPLYLTAMEVAPDRQRQGVGRLCIDEARHRRPMAV